MESKVLIHIIKEIETVENTIQVEEFITDLFVFTKQKDNDVFYRKDKDKLYAVNKIAKNITPISLDQRQQQVNQFKKLFSEIDVREKEENESRKVFIEGKGNMVVLSGEVKISKFPDLEHTANLGAYTLLSKSALVDIDMKNNEITNYADININVQGKRIKNKTVIKNIEVLTTDINRYDYLLNYSVN
ncbi:hypothetical protein [Aquimarina sp. AU58]|uniref:hypothetical protein n=1 Tax=Aquimarina sp. AU58 TaxID=1874112 RepID=UPI000D6467A0|nr:hypothetical protein [Aquimarina sp. AU58]